jgi:AraC-like DNA-binding protein
MPIPVKKETLFSSANQGKMRQIYDLVLYHLEEKHVYLNKQLDLKTFSKLLCTNTTYLSYVINQRFGRNLKTLINEYRVEHAKQLLRSSHLSINDIGKLCGFTSRSTFYLTFKKIEQQTPCDYRRQQINRNKITYAESLRELNNIATKKTAL